MQLKRGNLIDLAFEGHFDIIVQGCNCQCRMKSGIAKEIARRIPKAEEIDNETVIGDKSKLGKFTTCFAWSDEELEGLDHTYVEFDG